MKAIHIRKFGEKLALKSVSKPQINNSEQLLVRVKYAPINPSDIYYSKGMYGLDKSLPRTIGFEGSGIVEQTNEQSKYLLGKSVAFMAKGSWAEYAVVEKNRYILYGENLSEENYKNICCSFINPVSALAMLQGVRNRGENCLINSAARSSLGKILIRAAKKKGIKTINIVRKEDQISELLQLGADYVLNSLDKDFQEKLLHILEKEKPLSFYDAIGGEFLPQILNLMQNKSTVYSYGIFSLKALTGLDPSQLIFKKKCVKGFWLSDFLDNTSEENVKEILEEVAKNINDYCKTDVYETFDGENINKAINEYNSNMNKGKILLKF